MKTTLLTLVILLAVAATNAAAADAPKKSPDRSPGELRCPDDAVANLLCSQPKDTVLVERTAKEHEQRVLDSATQHIMNELKSPSRVTTDSAKRGLSLLPPPMHSGAAFRAMSQRAHTL